MLGVLIAFMATSAIPSLHERFFKPLVQRQIAANAKLHIRAARSQRSNERYERVVRLWFFALSSLGAGLLIAGLLR
jgi:hypothetical protein